VAGYLPLGPPQRRRHRDLERDGKGAVQLTLRRPGVADPIGNFALPPGDGLLLAAANDTAFAYIPAKGDKGTFLLRRSDGSFARELPQPRGEFFFSQDADNKLVAHSTMSNTDRPLGTFDRDVILDSRTRTLYFCGMRGLVRLSIASPTPQTLDGSPCSPSILRLSSGSILYLRQDGLREISESGVARLLVPAPIGQLLAVGPNGSLVYSSDPPLTYGAGIGDGWIGDWRLMNRGRRPTYSIDAADPACNGTDCLAALTQRPPVVIDRARWDAGDRELKVEGSKAPPGSAANLFDANTGALLASVAVRSDGRWAFELERLATVPCKVRVDIAGQSAEAVVSGAPATCGGGGNPPPGNLAPDGRITAPADGARVRLGRAVQFSGSGSDPDGNLPLTYAWDFGGGAAASTAQNPSVTFRTAGTYVVRLTVRDAKGLADPTPAQITVRVVRGD
jgi:hypothetical protein